MRTAPRLCSLSRRTLDAAKARGELPFYKIGAKVLIARADLTAWMEARRVDVRADVARIEALAAGEV